MSQSEKTKYDAQVTPGRSIYDAEGFQLQWKKIKSGSLSITSRIKGLGSANDPSSADVRVFSRYNL